MPEYYYYYQEITQTYQISEKFIRECLQKQWIEPLDKDAGKLSQEDIARLMLIRDLMEDMGVNDESVPVILNLIDQIHALKRKARLLGEKAQENVV
jgi:chaperone modulatory protein CbpM